MPEKMAVGLMLNGCAWIGLSLIVTGVMFALIMLAIENQHKRNWLGSLAIAFCILSIVLLLNFFSRNNIKARTELIRALFYFPDRVEKQESRILTEGDYETKENPQTDREGGNGNIPAVP